MARFVVSAALMSVCVFFASAAFAGEAEDKNEVAARVVSPSSPIVSADLRAEMARQAHEREAQLTPVVLDGTSPMFPVTTTSPTRPPYVLAQPVQSHTPPGEREVPDLYSNQLVVAGLIGAGGCVAGTVIGGVTGALGATVVFALAGAGDAVIIAPFLGGAVGGVVGCPLGGAGGVALFGAFHDQQGSFAASALGSFVGMLVGAVAFFIPVVGVFAVPALTGAGATVGYVISHKRRKARRSGVSLRPGGGVRAPVGLTLSF